MKILVVRLGALGDLVHTVPAVAALRRAYPGARIDWLVKDKQRAFVDLVESVDCVLPMDDGSLGGWVRAAQRLRAVRYDIALDFQGLMKSAVLARASGASRVLGFSIWHLREKSARPFYSEVGDAARAQRHVIFKNLHLVRTLGIASDAIEFPLRRVPSAAVDRVRELVRGGPFAIVNPGAAWPNKQWPAARFGEVASFLREVRGLTSVVIWGPGEEPLAQEVVRASDGAAHVAPATGIADLVALARAASLIVSGDTGPLHLAAAAGTPAIALFGPTDPERNGPWRAEDISVSRYATCRCHYQRRCTNASWCLESITTAEVTAAIQRRLVS